ncbi:MAG: hypothetical protein ACREMM_07540 [Gemmatimonadales bacterium]
MQRFPSFGLFLLAASCWLAAGPGGVTIQAMTACQHHETQVPHGDHSGVPSDGPCFCDEMTGGSDLALSPAVPAPVVAPPVVTPTVRAQLDPSPFSLPPSPSFAPIPPPPNGLV